MSEREPTAAEVHRLFQRLVDLDDGARADLLDQACAPRLRVRVERLLDRLDDDESPLDEGAAERWAGLVAGDDVASGDGATTEQHAIPGDTAFDDATPDHVGPYRILGQLGRGGMGTVYRARRADGEVEMDVALKLVRRGMDTDDIVARFRHERRILAGLDHPHIARLFDGGASQDGRPYLVMELVDGEPITRHCNANHLTIDQRLALFQQVCAAVQHAHQSLVIHRDLKPGNILVTRDGTPKLLDFGIAKLLDTGGGTGDDPDTPRTRTGVRVLTPGYAAPEQIRGAAVTTATDVYALGAILYELLTGHRPAREAGARAEDRLPVRPSVGVRREGESEDRDRARDRSRSDRLARRLAGDLDTIVLKALDPDVGRRYASVQQLLDDIRRHRQGLPVLARPATLAYRARKFVRRNRAAVAGSLVLVLSLAGGMGATVWQARHAAMQRDLADLERGNAQEVAAFLVDLLGSADPLGGRTERTDTLRVRALVDRGAAQVTEDLSAQPRLQARLLAVLGRVYTGMGAFDRADSVAGRALAIAGDHDAARERAEALSVLASSARQQGAFPRADSLLRTLIAGYDQGLPPDSLLVESLGERGLVLGYLGRYDEAAALHDRALELLNVIQATRSPLHARLLGNVATLRFDLGEFPAAETATREALAIERATLHATHPRIASSLNNLGSIVQYQGRLADAEPLFREAIDLARAGLGPDHVEVGVYLQNLATLYDDLERHAEARPHYLESVRIHENALGRENVNTALLLRNYALNRFAVGEMEQAEALLAEALATMRGDLGEDHLYSAVAAAALGRVQTAAGRLEEAEPHLHAALAALSEQLPEGHYLIETSRRDLGAWHAARGDLERAEPLLLESHRALLESRGADHYLTREARAHLHALYERMGRPEEAARFAPDA